MCRSLVSGSVDRHCMTDCQLGGISPFVSSKPPVLEPAQSPTQAASLILYVHASALTPATFSALEGGVFVSSAGGHT